MAAMRPLSPRAAKNSRAAASPAQASSSAPESDCALAACTSPFSSQSANSFVIRSVTKEGRVSLSPEANALRLT